MSKELFHFIVKLDLVEVGSYVYVYENNYLYSFLQFISA